MISKEGGERQTKEEIIPEGRMGEGQDKAANKCQHCNSRRKSWEPNSGKSKNTKNTPLGS